MAETPEKDDQTEEPTERKLEEAIKRGDVAKSAEINTLFVLGGFTLALMATSAHIGPSLVLDLRGFLMNAHLVPIDATGLSAVGGRALWAGVAAIALPIIFIVFGGLAAEQALEAGHGRQAADLRPQRLQGP